MTDTPEASLDEMLETCLEKTKGGAKDFIESLHEFYENNDFLTEKQEAALRKFYGNITRRKKK